ncbi:unnamed protein product [Moneuplotes crassus]|uniref:Uncharacterized protein n=1 Tax=Euplotes crassus TaxID=5936 RepID=A0AAD1XQV9_EUPCR|nr:unnamed protein product [Moneuplotes crassus]
MMTRVCRSDYSSSSKSSDLEPNLSILQKEKRLDQDIGRILLEKHEMLYQLQFQKVSLKIDFNLESGDKYIKEVKKLGKIGLENCSEVILNNIKRKRCPMAKDILSLVPKKKLKKFIFDCPGQYSFKPFAYYQQNLIKMVSFATKEVSLVGMEISNFNFRNIIVSTNSVKELCFRQCSISTTEVCLIKPDPYLIQTLAFVECGSVKYSDWKQFPEKLFSILQAISETSLTRSLQKIELLDNGISVQEIQGYNTCGGKKEDRLSLPGVKFELLDETLDSYMDFEK